LALHLAGMILPTWGTIENGSRKTTLGLWSQCESKYDTSVCVSLPECNIFHTSLCAKRQAARTFMGAAIFFLVCGLIYLIMASVLYFKRRRDGDGAMAVFLYIHFFSFLAGVIGFPIGITFGTGGIFSIVGITGSMGLAAILAIVGNIMSFLGMILSCVGMMNSEQKTGAAGQNTLAQIQIGGNHPSNPSA